MLAAAQPIEEGRMSVLVDRTFRDREVAGSSADRRLARRCRNVGTGPLHRRGTPHTTG